MRWLSLLIQFLIWLVIVGVVVAAVRQRASRTERGAMTLRILLASGLVKRL